MRSALFGIVVYSVLGICGCSNTTTTQTGSSESATESPTTDSTSGTSAAATEVKITVDALPETVCEHFINLLRAGDTDEAERFMTQKALAQIRSCELELSAPGGPKATYRYQPAEFASAKQEIAFVPCVVVDGGETEQFSMMLRRGDVGWKIAGMLLQTDEAGADLVSFENPNDVVRIKSMLGLDSPADQQAAAAAATLR